MVTQVSITNKTKSTLPRVPFASMKNTVLGEGYLLSLVFIGNELSKKLNYSYRGKNKPTNILSFPMDKKSGKNPAKNPGSGEIFITPSVVRKQTKLFGRDFKNLIAFLFIHGLLHLKGMEHGSRMERAEIEIRKKFRI